MMRMVRSTQLLNYLSQRERQRDRERSANRPSLNISSICTRIVYKFKYNNNTWKQKNKSPGICTLLVCFFARQAKWFPSFYAVICIEKQKERKKRKQQHQSSQCCFFIQFGPYMNIAPVSTRLFLFRIFIVQNPQANALARKITNLIMLLQRKYVPPNVCSQPNGLSVSQSVI